MADEEILKLKIDLSSAEADLVRFGSTGVETANKIKKAFGDVHPPPGHGPDDHANKFGEAFERMAEKGGQAIAQLSAKYGAGGKLIGEFAEKTIASLGKIPLAIQSVGSAFA